MISRYLYPVSQFQPTHVPSQEPLVLNGSDAFVLITVGIKSVAESHRMFLEKYNKPLQNLFGLLYFPASVQTTIFILLIHMNLTIPACVCQAHHSSCHRHFSPAAMATETRYALANLALISGRQIHCTSACIFLVTITKSRRTSCPPDRLPSAFYYSYIMIPHPCSHAQCAWQDNRSPYLPELPGAPCSYAHRQSSPVHMILETYTLHNHSC